MTMIIDTTLREGEQSPGVYFTPAQKLRIIDGVARAGVEEMELGIASPLIDTTGALLDYCKKEHPGLDRSLWSRCREEDIRFAAELKADIISLSLPVSDVLIEKKMEKTREWTVTRLRAAISFADSLGLKVAVGFEDASRAELRFILQLTEIVRQSGAFRLRLADTIGTSSPAEMASLVTEVAKVAGGCHIYVHCHNDFGMATANAVSAIEHGAAGADAALLGLGERCGCTRLEELAGYLHLKRSAAYDMGAITALCRHTAGSLGRKIAGNQPFTGKDIFTCETGLHLQALQKHPETYEPYAPETVGMRRRLLLGPKAGRKAIIGHLRQKGYGVPAQIDDETVRNIRRCLTDQTTTDDTLAAFLPALPSASIP